MLNDVCVCVSPVAAEAVLKWGEQQVEG